MIKRNYHTHTKRCGHAIGEDEEYVINAIEAGLTDLGFSDHCPYIDKEPNMVIVEGVKGGNSRIKIEPPLIVYKEPGVYTEQLLATYEGEAKK